MKRLISATMLATCLLAVAPSVRAQNCSTWSNYDLRGTYTTSGSGWIDLSKLASGLPSGTIPMAWVGAETMNGLGQGSGWVAVNAGVVQLSIQLVNLTYAIQTDCSVLISYSMKIKELGATIGPVSRILAIGARGPNMDLYGIQAGGGAGMPVDVMSKHRISMEY